MNKLMILLLAVCLVSVHAFVKRDAPANQNSEVQAQIDAFRKQLEDIGKQIADKVAQAGGQAANAINPDEIKSKFNEFVDNVSKALDSVKPTPQPAA